MTLGKMLRNSGICWGKLLLLEGIVVKFSYLTVVCGMLLLAAYSHSTGASSTTSDTNVDVASVEQTVTPAIATSPRRGALLKQDLGNGQRKYNACRGCHLIDGSGRNTVGPNLYGVFGRDVGSVEGFNYSNSLRESELVWTEETMDEFLAAPRTFMPGNRMPYAGMRNAVDRADLIAWLVNETAPAVDEAGE